MSAASPQPRGTDGLHGLAEQRSLELHREVVCRLAAEPQLAELAWQRVLAWQASGVLAAEYARRWLQLLGGPRETLLSLLVEDSEEARALRQSTPFTFIVPPKERWAIWRAARRRWEGGR